MLRRCRKPSKILSWPSCLCPLKVPGMVCIKPWPILVLPQLSPALFGHHGQIPLLNGMGAPLFTSLIPCTANGFPPDSVSICLSTFSTISLSVLNPLAASALTTVCLQDSISPDVPLFAGLINGQGLTVTFSEDPKCPDKRVAWHLFYGIQNVNGLHNYPGHHQSIPQSGPS